MVIFKLIKKAGKTLFSAFSFRLYLLYFTMVGGSAWFIAQHSLQALETSVNQVAEEVLIDTAHLFAELLEQDVDDGQLRTERFADFFPHYLARTFNAKVYQQNKTHPSLHVYITDDKGIVRYDSSGRYVGEDFSQWHDIYATLAGGYGARSSPIDNAKVDAPDSEKALFIAAPIRDRGRIIGAVTVIKANRDLRKYLLLSNREVILYAIFVLLTSLVAGAFATWWLWRSIRKLSRYARQLGGGERIARPRIIHNEFKPLAEAMENMYEELAGKEYVENYIHTLAHELKSPLTGVIASTELLQQDLPAEARRNFTQNIHDSATRMTALIDRLLRLASLEKQHALDSVVDIDLEQMLDALIAERQMQCKQKHLSIIKHYHGNHHRGKSYRGVKSLRGEPTLLAQSIANLLDNAIDFSPQGGQITVSVSYDRQAERPFTLTIADQGAGIASFAEKRLFERFYSTPRPDTQQRSSGLGLAFVKEVMVLHGGHVSVENHPDGGAIATLRLRQSVVNAP